MTHDGLLFSIIIPACNEEKLIGQCLESIAQQTPPAPAFEVLVVDNGSTDSTVKVAAEYSSHFPVEILIRPGIRISELRNHGAAQSSGAYMAFLDADCTVPSDWLAAASIEFAANPDRVLGGHCRVPPEMGWLSVWYDRTSLNRRLVVPYIPGAGLLIERSRFFRIGGFDPSIQTAEDCEFCARAHRVGIPSVAIASLAVTHHGWPQTLRVFYRKNRWHGSDVARVFLRDLDLKSLKALSLAFYTDITMLLSFCMIIAKFPNIAGVLVVLWLLVCAAVACRLSLRRRGLHTALLLWPLVCLYGIARGSCLVDPRMWKPDRSLRSVART